MPLGIDPALAQSLRDIDPEHLSVSHWSAVSGLGVLKIQYEWHGDLSVTQQQSHHTVWGLQDSKYIVISLWLSLIIIIIIKALY